MSVIGEDETSRLIAEDPGELVSALLSNPLVGHLLEKLYKREGVFATLPDDRFRGLIQISIGNPLLKTRADTHDGPDLTSWNIQKAIFQLIETAPVTPHWAQTLNWLLWAIDPQFAASPPDIDNALLRWSTCEEPKDYKGNPPVYSR